MVNATSRGNNERTDVFGRDVLKMPQVEREDLFRLALGGAPYQNVVVNGSALNSRKSRFANQGCVIGSRK